MSKKLFTSEYPLPAVTVDIVLFTITRQGQFDVLLIKRRDDPFKGAWALPGGFVEVGMGYRGDADQGESLYAAAARELKEETNLDVEKDGLLLEQLCTFGDPGRDPRGRVISVAYYALVGMDVAPRVRAGDDAEDFEWRHLWDGPGGASRSKRWAANLAFDHAEVLKTAVARVQAKIDYDPRIARALLPAEFTLAEFQDVHEIVKGKTYDRANFAKRFRRMVEDQRIVPLKATLKHRSAGRPAKLYCIKDPT